MSDGSCEFRDSDGDKCGTESEVVDKNGKNLCMEHYRYVRDGEKAQRKPRKKKYMKGV